MSFAHPLGADQFLLNRLMHRPERKAGHSRALVACRACRPLNPPASRPNSPASPYGKCPWRQRPANWVPHPHRFRPEDIMKVMLLLRLKSPAPDHLAHHAPFPQMHPDFPLKPKVEPKTDRTFQIMSLPQKDGSYVASVVEAPGILVYDRSRKVA